MTDVRSISGMGYRFLAGVFQYSAGVAAEPGFAIERARFLRPVLLEEGFRAVETHLRRKWTRDEVQITAQDAAGNPRSLHHRAYLDPM